MYKGGGLDGIEKLFYFGKIWQPRRHELHTDKFPHVNTDVALKSPTLNMPTVMNPLKKNKPGIYFTG